MTEACITLTITKIMYGWSKWGGANNGVATLMGNDEWYCQACQQQQTKNLPSYMFPLDAFNRDYAKICARCKNVSVKKQIENYFKLRAYMRNVIRTAQQFEYDGLD